MKLLLCCLMMCGVCLPVSAHVLDQYLQVAQIALAPGGVRVELRLTPGAQVYDCFRLLIDANRDGKISESEEQIYAYRVLKNVALALDQQPLSVALTKAHFPALSEMKEGLGAIRLVLTAQTSFSVSGSASGNHQLTFRNDHLPELGIYLANAMVPESDDIKINRQERDALQRELRIHFQARANSRGSWSVFFLSGFCLALALIGWRLLRRAKAEHFAGHKRPA